MPSRLFRGVLLSGLLLSPVAVFSIDVQRGKALYENHCIKCHESTLHLREDRRAKTVEDVRSQVVRWSQELGLGWGYQEIEDVRQYLSSTFYNFTQTQ